MVIRGGEGAGKKKERIEGRERIRRTNVNCFLRACIILSPSPSRKIFARQ